MGVYIKGLEMPETCDMCPIEGCEYIYKKFTCPLIEIDETDTELLEFFNEFKKWKNCKEVAKYIRAVYGERRTDPNNCKECELTDKCDHHICLKAVREGRADE